MERGFIPGAIGHETAIFVAAGVSGAFGLVLITEPPHPPFTGRYALVSSLLYDVLGPWGMPMVCWVLAVIGFIAALSMRRERLGRKPGN